MWCATVGYEAAQELAESSSIAVELASSCCVVCAFGSGSTLQHGHRLAEALRDLSARHAAVHLQGIAIGGKRQALDDEAVGGQQGAVTDGQQGSIDGQGGSSRGSQKATGDRQNVADGGRWEAEARRLPEMRFTPREAFAAPTKRCVAGQTPCLCLKA